MDGLRQLCKRNLLLSAEKVLGSHWLPLLNDAYLNESWRLGLAALLSQIVEVSPEALHICVLSGLGVEGVMLVPALAAAAMGAGKPSEGQAAGSCSTATDASNADGSAFLSPRITCVVPDQLSQALALQVAAANGLKDAIAVTTSAEGVAAGVNGVFAPALCGASLTVGQVRAGWRRIVGVRVSALALNCTASSAAPRLDHNLLQTVHAFFSAQFCILNSIVCCRARAP